MPANNNLGDKQPASYEIWINGTSTWEVKQNGTTVPGAHVKQVEFEEGHMDGPNGRTYYPIPHSGRGRVRLPDGTEVSGVPLKVESTT